VSGQIRTVQTARKTFCEKYKKSFKKTKVSGNTADNIYARAMNEV
jgi:hypothetical protein